MTEEKQNPYTKSYEQTIAEILKKQSESAGTDEQETSEEDNEEKESE